MTNKLVIRQTGTSLPSPILLSIGIPLFLLGVLSSLFFPRHRFSTDRYIPYSNLEDIDESLQKNNFKKADAETTALIFKSLGKEKIGQIGKLDVPNFSCKYLLKLDDIWKIRSKGKFGFTAQSAVLSKLQVDKNFNPSESNFRDMLGWTNDNEKNSLNIYPKGYFPRKMYEYNFVVAAFSQRIAECQKDK